VEIGNLDLHANVHVARVEWIEQEVLLTGFDEGRDPQAQAPAREEPGVPERLGDGLVVTPVGRERQVARGVEERSARWELEPQERLIDGLEPIAVDALLELRERA
jgi:hypothetical protein